MKRKGLIAFDLDGTLIDGFDRFYPGRLETIEELSKEYYITIASGRSWESIRRFAFLLNIEIPYISYDGALLRDRDGRTYHAIFMDQRELRRMEEFQRRYSVPFVLFDEDYSRIHPQVEEYGTIVSHWRLNYVKDYIFDLSEKPAIKLIMMRENHALIKEIFRHVVCMRGGLRGVYMYPSRKRKGLWILDMTHESVNKGIALRKLAQILDVEKVVAVGDYLNDIPMFRVSDIAVAIEPTLDAVRQEADYVISDFRDLLGILL